MTRAHRVGVVTVAFTLSYLLVYFSFLSIPFIPDDVSAQIIPTLPWWLLVSFGSYSLWSLGMGILTFKECPDAYYDVLEDVKRAKMDLRARGLQID